MRTTITLDDHLLARLKKRASDSGTSVSGLIERAVRLLLQTPAPARNNEHFELVTFGKGAHFTRFNIDSAIR
jgi:metal-responsive CopG/Arc/MetJ family transcriptional regulator